jgi:hypothetical protein
MKVDSDLISFVKALATALAKLYNKLAEADLH